MPSEDEIGDILTNKQNSSFNASVGRILNEFLKIVIAGWVKSCFEKYSEEFFHQKMREQFNFIDDWKTNHPEKYNSFVKKARKLKYFFRIDENDIMNRVETLLIKNNWKLYPEEKEMIMSQIIQFKKEIYG